MRGLEEVPATDVLAHAVDRHHPNLVMACSFQKEESVLIDMLMRIETSARVFTIDTGALFPDTYEVWRKIEDRYGLRVEVFDASSMNGPWTPDNCCGVRKVAALERALTGADAWITGIRREQSPTRSGAPKEEWQEERGLWKFNPLADWTEDDVWRYVHEHDLPYHPLHDQGYESIGCAPCTLPGAGRAGRWAGSEKTECGLHV
ncbi:MAG: phosphoadenylyl-sulfate reductase [Thermoleophilaceae bacterium]|nr:phosphoadenylyl-sulfate reductase [Thermoleophilaceae bacterium]